jgi:type IV pilus modification protein PilV
MWRLHCSINENHRSQSRKKGSQQGFSLVEVMVAILLLTVGLLALAKMQTHAVASNAFGYQLTQATFLAQDKLEELRLLNECYLEVSGRSQISWTTADQDVVDNYNSQLSDSVDNWDENDGPDPDDIPDQFSWQPGTPDHNNSDGPAGVANPIDVTGATVSNGGYTRTWYVVEARPMSKAKIIQVRVTWRGKKNEREVTLDTVLSQ